MLHAISVAYRAARVYKLEGKGLPAYGQRGPREAPAAYLSKASAQASIGSEKHSRLASLQRQQRHAA